MTIVSEISVGEMLMVVATACAFIVALFIGKKQNSINQNLLVLQDIVELYVGFDIRRINNTEIETIQPIMKIHNLSSMVVYLEYYVFNGRKYPVGNVALPTKISFPEFSYNIELPTNGENHVSFEIYIIDPLGRRWFTEGFADLINSGWIVTHQRCQKLK